MLLTDIAIEHTKKSRKGGPDETFLMHPFENSQGINIGKYEVLRDIIEPGRKKIKRSAHVTLPQLAELYAKGLIEDFSIRLRLRPSEGNYPTAPPGKKVPACCIKTGSPFGILISRIDNTKPVSDDLKRVLMRMNIQP